MSGKELLKLLESHGWTLDRIKGSHYILVSGNKTDVVPVHGNRDVPKGTLNAILKTGRSQMIAYPAKILYDRSDKAYLVEFPDLPGCVTYGASLEEAQKNAAEALSGYLESIDQRSVSVPKASRRRSRQFFLIRPEKAVAFAIWLKRERELIGLTQKDVAQKLGVSYQTYQRFEDPAKANPTLKTIQKLEDVFHREVLAV